MKSRVMQKVNREASGAESGRMKYEKLPLRLEKRLGPVTSEALRLDVEKF